MNVDLSGLQQASLRGVDIDSIRRQVESLADPYDIERWVIPLPLWARRDYDNDGATAWETLRADLHWAAESRPVCIYLHVPFCSRKCSFCDCYSFRLSPGREEEKARYVRRLCSELDLWSAQGSLAERPISTVHFGGGTPTFLGPELLAQLTDACRSGFNVTEHTEWALESTVEGLSTEMVDTMQQCGFTRLHVGVQSLQDPVRKAIGRRNSSSEVLDRLGQARDMGWIVSVDLVAGLPFQTITSFAADVEILIEEGMNGVSLYELLIYRQNQLWAERMGLGNRSHVPNYLMFQLAAEILERHGYRKNTFNHWADDRDDNRYFTFPTRNEDCLAIGAIADGVLGDYHFRHPRYGPYVRSPSHSPGLEGGLRRTPVESELHAVTTALMAGYIPKELVPCLLREGDGPTLRERWIDLGLVRETDDGGLSLLTNGSWFAGNMIQELTTSRTAPTCAASEAMPDMPVNSRPHSARATQPGSAEAVGRVAALTHDTGLVLGQIAVDGKSNEIPAMRDLLGNVSHQVGDGGGTQHSRLEPRPQPAHDLGP